MKSSESACDRAVARYRERIGKLWRATDDILFRAAWNEGAREAQRKTERILDALARIPEQDLKAWLVEPPLNEAEAYQALACAELDRRQGGT